MRYLEVRIAILTVILSAVFAECQSGLGLSEGSYRYCSHYWLRFMLRLSVSDPGMAEKAQPVDDRWLRRHCAVHPGFPAVQGSLRSRGLICALKNPPVQAGFLFTCKNCSHR